MTGAFNSALAETDIPDQKKIDTAMTLLGQKDLDNLVCIYCKAAATTWDHLHNTTRDGNFTGYGHQVRNLVPSCGPCNSKKGKKDWRIFVRAECGRRANALIETLEKYSKPVERAAYPTSEIRKISKKKMERYDNLLKAVLQIMGEADELATEIRADIAADKKRRRDRKGKKKSAPVKLRK